MVGVRGEKAGLLGAVSWVSSVTLTRGDKSVKYDD